MATKVNHPVNHPEHYNQGKIEVIDFIEDQSFQFSLGNAIKYICRAGKKANVADTQDLQKAKWYLERKHQDRGFKEKKELTLEGGKNPLHVKEEQIVSIETLKTIPLDVRKQLLQAIEEAESGDSDDSGGQ